MEALIELSNKHIRNCSMDFIRFMLHEIDWNDRLIAIMGSRGAGKTTLMLQHLKETYGTGSTAIYISLDNVYFAKNSLIDVADYFVKMGGIALYVDEVHKYPNWSIELKNLYDNYPELKVVFSGSSMLELYKGQGDLSRRLSSYLLPSLSFREFVALEHGVNFASLTLDDILANHIEISHTICEKVKPIALFADYLEFGALPFYRESRLKYHERLNNVVNMTLDYDLPSITPTDYAHVIKIKMLLKIISDLVPYKPNITKLATQIGIDRKTVLKYLDLLHKSGLISMLLDVTTSDSIFTKPQKIYLGNPNFMFALCDEKPNKGTLRETFFNLHVAAKHKVHVSKTSDFLVDKKYTFEVGGKHKGAAQIADTPNSYLVKDMLEYGFGSHIPLWMFGFLY
jgi:predicted AAA+ superfamily ATPase